MFTIEELTDLVDTALAQTECERLSLPHVVCVFDRLTGLPSVFGPFSDPISASVAAADYVRDVGCDYSGALDVRVVPLDPGITERSRLMSRVMEHFHSVRHLRGVRRVRRRSKRGM
jgi:hypothetical protein